MAAKSEINQYVPSYNQLFSSQAAHPCNFFLHSPSTSTLCPRLQICCQSHLVKLDRQGTKQPIIHQKKK
uniref:Uncharacterized protein n=1 Tax=Arundo donax TaxID=35708 RepID=A0A0A9SCH2_ARUDO